MLYFKFNILATKAQKGAKKVPPVRIEIIETSSSFSKTEKAS